MPYSRRSPDLRRKVYLALAGSIESQIRDAYAKRHDSGLETQASLARKLGVSRSVVNRRLTGQANMTIATLADLVWALENCIEVDIFDPIDRPDKNSFLAPELLIGSTAPSVAIRNTAETSSTSDAIPANYALENE